MLRHLLLTFSSSHAHFAFDAISSGPSHALVFGGPGGPIGRRHFPFASPTADESPPRIRHSAATRIFTNWGKKGHRPGMIFFSRAIDIVNMIHKTTSRFHAYFRSYFFNPRFIEVISTVSFPSFYSLSGVTTTYFTPSNVASASPRLARLFSRWHAHPPVGRRRLGDGHRRAQCLRIRTVSGLVGGHSWRRRSSLSLTHRLVIPMFQTPFEDQNFHILICL